MSNTENNIKLPATVEKPILILTYGTLITGQGNHRCMVAAKGESCGMAKSKNNFDMFSLGGFPSVSLAHSEHGVPVKGEVFRVDEDGLRGPLDMLEGHRGNDNPHTFYKRTQIEVVLEDGTECLAWIYHIDDQKPTPIADGDWVKFDKTRERRWM